MFTSFLIIIFVGPSGRNIGQEPERESVGVSDEKEFEIQHYLV